MVAWPWPYQFSQLFQFDILCMYENYALCMCEMKIENVHNMLRQASILYMMWRGKKATSIFFIWEGAECVCKLLKHFVLMHHRSKFLPHGIPLSFCSIRVLKRKNKRKICLTPIFSTDMLNRNALWLLIWWTNTSNVENGVRVSMVFCYNLFPYFYSSLAMTATERRWKLRQVISFLAYCGAHVLYSYMYICGVLICTHI